MGAARRRTGAHDGVDPGLGRAGVRQGDVMNPTIQPVNDGETRAAQFIVLPPGEDPSDDDVGQGRGRPLFRCPDEFPRLHRRLQTACHLDLASDLTKTLSEPVLESPSARSRRDGQAETFERAEPMKHGPYSARVAQWADASQIDLAIGVHQPLQRTIKPRPA
ncbi:hypothetical protein D3C80_1128330 [compost metagenome]